MSVSASASVKETPIPEGLSLIERLVERFLMLDFVNQLRYH